jgi:hypothetical protein
MLLNQLVGLQALAAQVRVAKREAKAAASLILQQELKARRRVLRRLGCALLPRSPSSAFPLDYQSLSYSAIRHA